MAVTAEIIDAVGVDNTKVAEAKIAAQKAANSFGCEVEIITRDDEDNPLARIIATPE